VGLFDWTDALKLKLFLNVVEAYDVDMEIARRKAIRLEGDEEDQERIERARWLEEERAERSFPCGIVLLPDPPWPVPGRPRAPEVPPPPAQAPSVTSTPPVPVPPPEFEAAAPLLPTPVIAAVLPKDIVFVVEDPEGEDVEEVGRLPRTAIQDIDVVDEGGNHVPEPIHETLEPSQLVFTVLRWSNEGTPDEDRFAFRSPWMAWTAGTRLLEARKG
jgi:hypothetical protein